MAEREDQAAQPASQGAQEVQEEQGGQGVLEDSQGAEPSCQPLQASSSTLVSQATSVSEKSLPACEPGGDRACVIPPEGEPEGGPGKRPEEAILGMFTVRGWGEALLQTGWSAGEMASILVQIARESEDEAVVMRAMDKIVAHSKEVARLGRLMNTVDKTEVLVVRDVEGNKRLEAKRTSREERLLDGVEVSTDDLLGTLAKDNDHKRVLGGDVLDGDEEFEDE